MSKLSEAQVSAELPALAGWEYAEGKLTLRIAARSYRDAQRLVNLAADIAEQQNHHPDITWTYDTLRIDLWSHDVSGLSERDFAFARAFQASRQ